MTPYAHPTVIKQRKSLVESILLAPYGGRRDLARRICARLSDRPYRLIEEGHVYDLVWAATADEALAIAKEGVDRSNYDRTGEGDGTMWIDVEACNALDPLDGATATVMLEPDEPDCEEGNNHDWQTPYSVLGGLETNPGVWGHGGGVIMRSVCAHCGAYRKIDTWAQRMDTGECGLTSVSYEPADEESLEWVSSKAEND